MKTKRYSIVVCMIVFGAYMLLSRVEGDECTGGIRKEHLDTTPGALVDNQTIVIDSTSGLKVKVDNQTIAADSTSGLKVKDAGLTSANLQKYDSGWFAVSGSTTYTKAHGLGSVPFMAQVWISDTSDDTGRIIADPSYNEGMTIVYMDATNIKIRASSYICTVWDANGASFQPTSGYARIKAIK